MSSTAENIFSKADRQFMARALYLAKKAHYTARPNPKVGAVLVQNDQIIGEGFHLQAGLAHAEVNAMNDARSKGHSIEGATAYVTLEPCAHFGRQAPCAVALTKAKVSKVIFAMQDPNPLVSGAGAKILKDAGIEVFSGLLEAEAKKLNIGFVKRMRTGLPRVTIKIASSLDGRTAMASGESYWITGESARHQVQKMRAESGAIITGSGTVLQDNPRLNVRLSEYTENPNFQAPLKVILDTHNRIEHEAKLFQDGAPVWLVSGSELSEQKTRMFPKHVKHSVVSLDKKGRLDLLELLTKLGEAGVNDVLVEAGSRLAAAFIQERLMDELIVFMAPKIMGATGRPQFDLNIKKMSDSIQLEMLDVRHYGDDLMLRYRSVFS